MSFFKSIFSLCYILGYTANGLLYLYTIWAAKGCSKCSGGTLWNFINPIAYLSAIFDLLTTPLFWGLLAWSVVFVFAAAGVDRMNKEM